MTRKRPVPPGVQVEILQMKTITQVANEMDVVRSTAYKYLVAMDQNGMLQYREGRISITELDKIMIKLIDEPLEILLVPEQSGSN